MIWRMGEDGEEREKRVALEPMTWWPTKCTPMLPWRLECRKWEYSRGRVRWGALGRILYVTLPGLCSLATPLIWWDMFRAARRSITKKEMKQRARILRHKHIHTAWHHALSKDDNVVCGVSLCEREPEWTHSLAGHTWLPHWPQTAPADHDRRSQNDTIQLQYNSLNLSGVSSSLLRAKTWS